MATRTNNPMNRGRYMPPMHSSQIYAMEYAKNEGHPHSLLGRPPLRPAMTRTNPARPARPPQAKAVRPFDVTKSPTYAYVFIVNPAKNIFVECCETRDSGGKYVNDYYIPRFNRENYLQCSGTFEMIDRGMERNYDVPIQPLRANKIIEDGGVHELVLGGKINRLYIYYAAGTHPALKRNNLRSSTRLKMWVPLEKLFGAECHLPQEIKVVIRDLHIDKKYDDAPPRPKPSRPIPQKEKEEEVDYTQWEEQSMFLPPKPTPPKPTPATSTSGTATAAPTSTTTATPVTMTTTITSAAVNSANFPVAGKGAVWDEEVIEEIVEEVIEEVDETDPVEQTVLNIDRIIE